MASIQIEDLEGSMEVMVFAEAYTKYGMLLEDDAAILICGETGIRNNIPQLTANEIYPLADAPKHFAQQVRIHIPITYVEQGKLETIKNIIRIHPGTTPLIICLIFPAGEKAFIETGAGFAVCADESMIHEIEHELGEKSVYVTVNPNAYRFKHDNRRFRRKKSE